MLSSSKWSEYISSGEMSVSCLLIALATSPSAKGNVESSYFTSLRVLCKLEELLELLKLFRPTDPDVEIFVTLRAKSYTRGLMNDPSTFFQRLLLNFKDVGAARRKKPMR